MTDVTDGLSAFLRQGRIQNLYFAVSEPDSARPRELTERVPGCVARWVGDLGELCLGDRQSGRVKRPASGKGQALVE